ncbi:hypothetical protein HPB52_007006 [Rhipicephalus sanguineus]|uniref:Uncharacterized protein n=1 Tax=Rhipicephalus sanguineus TaxID=34632 RepID=A0A9D4T311_RHISA|nr:hypothetical protein HPB52_007006 [Rhipicephalus sanguineus]
MATGDIRNNLKMLSAEIRSVKTPSALVNLEGDIVKLIKEYSGSQKSVAATSPASAAARPRAQKVPATDMCFFVSPATGQIKCCYVKGRLATSSSP